MKRFLPLLLLALACPGPATDTTWDPAFDATSVGWLLSTFSPDGDVRYADIVDGKLYLNYNKKIQERWEQDQASYIVKADTNWPEVLK